MIKPQFQHAGIFSSGLAPVAMGKEPGSPKGYIDHAGRFAIAPRFFWAGSFANGLAATNHGFIDTTGHVVIPRTSRNGATGFSGGLAAVELDGRTAYVDTSGRVTLRSEYESSGDFAEGLAPACSYNCGPSTSSQNWGFIDETGRMVIKPQFGFVPEPFHEGLALVCFGCTG
ncbi:MAG: WG repeat-containing protein [Bryobacterales bacterium]|nr:WG repeat-containing protein [Bryobacterales bacterium]